MTNDPLKILIMGLPGSGKTTLAAALSKKLNAVHWNADEVRQNVNQELGFSLAKTDSLRQDEWGGFVNR